MTDAEWAIVAPLLPRPRDRGRRRRWKWREVLDAIFYVLRSGCPWRFLPDSFPPWRTVYHWFGELRDTGGFEDLNHHLVQMDRVRTGREPTPSAAVIGASCLQAGKRFGVSASSAIRWHGLSKGKDDINPPPSGKGATAGRSGSRVMPTRS